MIRTESSGGWQNHDCSIALPYVCKKKPNATATAELIQPGEPVTGGQGHPGHRPVQSFSFPADTSGSDSLSQLFNWVWRDWSVPLSHWVNILLGPDKDSKYSLGEYSPLEVTGILGLRIRRAMDYENM